MNASASLPSIPLSPLPLHSKTNLPPPPPPPPLPQTLTHKLPHKTRDASFEQYKDKLIRMANSGQIGSAVSSLSSAPHQPDLVSFSVLLRSCIRLRDLKHGQILHRLLLSSQLELDTAIFNSLITLYSKCGDYSTARSIFNELGKNRNLVSWTSMISSAANNGFEKDAIKLFYELIESGFEPESFSFCGVIQACSNPQLFSIGLIILGLSIKTGFSRKNPSVVSSLIDMFSKNDDLSSALKVFDELSEKNLLIYTQMITRLSQKGFGKEAIKLFINMVIEGQFEPDRFAISTVISACTELQSEKPGTQFHAFAIKTGMVSDVSVGSTLIDLYSKSKVKNSVNNARKVFEKMPERNVMTWTALISGLVQNGKDLEAFELFLSMILDGNVKPNHFTYSTILKSCANLSNWNVGKKIHAQIVKLGFTSINFVGNSLVSMYSNCGLMDEARIAFDQLYNKNMVSYNTLIDGYLKNSDSKEAFEISRKIEKMEMGINAFTFASLLSGAARVGLLTKGQKLHCQLIKLGFNYDLPINNSLISMYSKCGNLDDACKVFFDEMHEKNFISWTSMINGYSKHGYAQNALKLFDEMILNNVKPNEVTYLAVLTACSHVGLVQKGKNHFVSMQKDYKIIPKMEHYACMTDLFGRSGLIKEAFDFINSMPVKPDALIWRTLLGACKLHQNIEIGEFAAKNILKLEPQDTAAFVLLSNIYAKAGKWDEVAKIRLLMREKNVSKEVGMSWVEIENEIHEFCVGDTWHPNAKEVYEKLDCLIGEIKKIGYKPDLSCVLHDLDDELKEKFLLQHSEKITVAFGLMNVKGLKPIRVFKNLRVCADCHNAIKFISKVSKREIILRDTNRFHRFREGSCSYVLNSCVITFIIHYIFTILE
ncbi:hypothetical protein LUZ60_010094 [Juncus effusus]|nr:hypothetical protein LUZ60_010094 [Juncus effusus]